jgi:hypothetical protein
VAPDLQQEARPKRLILKEKLTQVMNRDKEILTMLTTDVARPGKG